MIILDTNVLSAVMAPIPEAAVVRWFARHSSSALYTTSITVAEIGFGLALLPRGKRRATLEDAARTVFEQDFDGRILSFDLAAARLYADVMAKRRRAGRPMAQMDGQIAAIALGERASIATRNVRDFEGCGVDLVNPWE